MYRKIILEILWSGSISTPTAILTAFTLSCLAMANVTAEQTESPTVSTEVAITELHSTLDTEYTSIPTIHPENELTTSQNHYVKTEGTTHQGLFPFIVTTTPQNAVQELDLPFSDLVITVIIFGVMAGIIGIILLIAFCIGRLRKKNSPGVAPELNQVAPLSSIETENPEK